MPPELGLVLLLGTANDGENIQEDVDDVRVQIQGRKHIFFWAQGQLLVPQEQLGVHCQELVGKDTVGILPLMHSPRHPREGLPTPSLTQVKSRAPSEAYTISRMRFRMKMQSMAKMKSTTTLTRSTPMHEVKS